MPAVIGMNIQPKLVSDSPRMLMISSAEELT